MFNASVGRSQDIELRSQLLEVIELNRILTGEHRARAANMVLSEDRMHASRLEGFQVMEARQQDIWAVSMRTMRERMDDRRAVDRAGYTQELAKPATNSS